MTEQTYMYKVTMSCQGCANAVTNALRKTDGVSNIDVSVENQTVTVTSVQPPQTLLAVLQKTGKKTEFVGQA